MKEIEVKILEVDVGEIERKLLDCGAKRVFDGEIVASYFDFSDNSLGQQQKVLRLRQVGKSTELALKVQEDADDAEAKIRQEYQVLVSEPEIARQILEGLGLRECRKIQKHRSSYCFADPAGGAIHFELDTFPDIPTFLEIEAPTLDEVYRYVATLGFSREDAKPWSFADVLRHYGKA
ncbi:MAG: class IV adenylate cyclase [Nanoarchaeota archaeon]|nr:class IV adenylate cyclase [Nanoarchaeota archaeon]